MKSPYLLSVPPDEVIEERNEASESYSIAETSIKESSRGSSQVSVKMFEETPGFEENEHFKLSRKIST